MTVKRHVPSGVIKRGLQENPPFGSMIERTLCAASSAVAFSQRSRPVFRWDQRDWRWDSRHLCKLLSSKRPNSKNHSVVSWLILLFGGDVSQLVAPSWRKFMALQVNLIPQGLVVAAYSNCSMLSASFAKGSLFHCAMHAATRSQGSCGASGTSNRLLTKWISFAVSFDMAARWPDNSFTITSWAIQAIDEVRLSQSGNDSMIFPAMNLHLVRGFV